MKAKEDTRVIYLTFAVKINSDADPIRVVSECKYSFEHADIVSSKLFQIRTATGG